MRHCGGGGNLNNTRTHTEAQTRATQAHVSGGEQAASRDKTVHGKAERSREHTAIHNQAATTMMCWCSSKTQNLPNQSATINIKPGFIE